MSDNTSHSYTSLPIIDISPWISDGREADSTAKAKVANALRDACLTYGFFYLDVSSLIHQDEMDELVRLATRFINLPYEEKMQIGLLSRDKARGA